MPIDNDTPTILLSEDVTIMVERGVLCMSWKTGCILIPLGAIASVRSLEGTELTLHIMSVGTLNICAGSEDRADDLLGSLWSYLEYQHSAPYCGKAREALLKRATLYP